MDQRSAFSGRFCVDQVFPLMRCARLVTSVFIVAILLHACAGPQTRYNYANGYHYVKRGETLFSISWRYNLDYKQVARWNRIAPPYTIYPQQRIRVRPPTNRVATQRKETTPSKATATQRKKTATKPRVVASAPSKWRWPVKGKIIEKYSNKNGGNSGIDIAARAGTSILAAAPGKVVYSGNGLRGYGNLVIIKHNASFLSAYAHNRKLLVKEGQSVKSGQKIAELGDTGTSRAKLHFEIRKNGKPVDPLRYLPR